MVNIPVFWPATQELVELLLLFKLNVAVDS